MGRVVFGIAGAVIGGLFGGFAGAAVGFRLGGLVGGLFAPDQRTVLPPEEGPRLGELTTQTSTYGNGIAFVWGSLRVAGNIIWSTDIEETRHEERFEQTTGGKGGPQQTTEQVQVSYTYSISFALALSEGPISGIQRIWADGQIVFDKGPGKDPATHIASSELGKRTRLYLGDETQEPDPLIESFEGVGEVPAHRGLAYIVFEDLQLAPYGNRVPNLEVEVVNAPGTAWEDLGQSAQTTFPEARLNNQMLGRDSTWDHFNTVAGFGANDDLQVRTLRYVNGQFASEFTKVFIRPTTAVFTGGFTPHWYRNAGVGYRNCYFADTPSTIISNPTGTTYAPGLTAIFVISWEINRWVAVVGSADSQTRIGFATCFMIWRNYVYFWCDPNINDVPLNNRINSGFAFADLNAAEVGSIKVAANLETIAVPIFLSLRNPFSAGFKSTDGSEVFDPMRTVSGWGIDDFGFYMTDFTDQSTLEITLTHYEHETGRVIDQWDLDVTFRGGNNADQFLTIYRSGDAEFLFGNIADGNGVPRIETWACVPGETTGTLISNDSLIFSQSAQDRREFGAYGYGVWYMTNVVGGAGGGNDGHRIRSFAQVFGGDGINFPVSTVVTDVVEKSGLSASDIDVTGLTQVTRGYTRARPMAGRAALEPLQTAHFFDAVESNGIIKFVDRVGSSVRTFNPEDLGARELGQEVQPEIEKDRKQETSLMRRVNVKFINSSSDYQDGEQYAARLATTSVSERTYSLPEVFDEDTGRALSEILLFSDWKARDSFTFQLLIKNIDLEPGDIVTINTSSGAQHVIRIESMELALPLLLLCRGTAYDASNYVNTADGAIGDAPGSLITWLSGPSAAVFLDLPPLRTGDTTGGFYVAMSGYEASWKGGVLYQSRNDQDWVSVGSVLTPTPIGSIPDITAGGLYDLNQPDSPNIPLRGAAIEVELLDQNLIFESVSEDSFLRGDVSSVAVGVDGRWEVLSYKTATPLGGALWRLEELIRGRRGTEFNMALHANFDQAILLKSTGLAYVSMDPSDTGISFFYRSVSLSGQINSVPSVQFSNSGLTGRPIAPFELTGFRDAVDDMQFTWYRRGRINGEWRDGVGVPLGPAELDEFVLRFFDGNTLRKTVDPLVGDVTGRNVYDYPLATRQADGFSTVDDVRIEVAQKHDGSLAGGTSEGSIATITVL